MNDKMDLSGVSKKVDTNVEQAREMYKLDKKKEELKELEKKLSKQTKKFPSKKQKDVDEETQGERPQEQ